MIWLISYPRSGNTWIRLLFANMLYPEQYRGHIFIDTQFPDLHHSDWGEVMAHQSLEPYFVKSHFLYSDLYREGKHIYIYRDGRDVALSCYYYGIWNKAHTHALPFKEYLHDRFIPGNVPYRSWKNHVDLWTRGHLDPCLIKYEDLLANPLQTVLEAVGYAEINVSREIIQQSVKITQFENVKAHAPGERVHPYKLGLRGTAGKWKEFYDEEMKGWFWKYAGDLLQKLGYKEDE